MYLTDDLNPVLDLNMTDVNPQMTRIELVAALPDGGAFVNDYVRSNRTSQVWRVNATGQVIQHVHQCVWKCTEEVTNIYDPQTCKVCNLYGLLVLNNNLYVIYDNGTLLEFDINNTNTVQVYQVPDVRVMVHSGSLSYHPSVITNPDLLLLADSGKGEIFSYNVTSKNKQVHLTGLLTPISASLMTYNSHLYYLVCEYNNHQVHVYNSTWGLFQTLGGNKGSDDGQFNNPFSAIGLPDGSVVISDSLNHRVCLFNIDGKFVRHLITQSHGLISRPYAMSISLPYLWVTGQDPIRLHRYRLY